MDLSKNRSWAHNAAQSLTPAMQMRREGNIGGFGSCHLHWVSKRHRDSLGTPKGGWLQQKHINN